MTGRISLTVQGNASQLTARDDPLRRKAVLGSLTEPAPTTNALAGRQISEMASHKSCCGRIGVGEVWGVPSTYLQGYRTAPRGQSQITHAPVPSTAAPGPPCGRATPDRRDATPVPVFKIVGYVDGTVRSLAGIDRLGSC